MNLSTSKLPPNRAHKGRPSLSSNAGTMCAAETNHGTRSLARSYLSLRMRYNMGP